MSICSKPKTWQVTQNIFEYLATDSKVFHEKVRQHYNYLFATGCCEITIIQEGRFDDAWDAFCYDKKIASLPSASKSKADHFQLSGILGYWLCRCAPVYDARALPGYKGESVLEKMLELYPSEFPAFNLGLYICSSFQTEQIDNPSSDVPDIEKDFDYYQNICFLLKRENLSPHALGMIYRSLFVPLRNKKKSESESSESGSPEEFFSAEDLKSPNKK